jgi:hypothetical protein
MAVPSSETRSWDALISTTLSNVRPALEDEISTSNAFLFFLMRKQSGGYVGESSLGDRLGLPLMYEMGTADVYSGYDQLDTTPMDGITTAWYDWRQYAGPIAISRIEERKNSGQHQLINLLKAKTKQCLLGLQDLFGKSIFQGNGPNSATAITTAYTSSSNGAVGLDPLPLQVKFDPTSSTSIGNINQQTYTWWANQYTDSAASSFAGHLKEFRHMFNLCSKGPGGGPNLFVADMNVYELYEAALAAMHRNPSYNVADIPFDNVAFKGKPLVWDEFVPDVDNGTVTSIPVAASGTMYFLNTNFWSIHYDRETNFINTPFVRPENQDAKVAHIMWYGAMGSSNRRKQGVVGGIATTTTS